MQPVQSPAIFESNLEWPPTSSPKASTPRVSFANTLKLEQVDGMLRPTSQSGKWQHIRQNNDKLANKLADLILQRNSLFQMSKLGQPVDWNRFDNLTGQLADQEINLFNRADLEERGLIPTTSKPDSRPTELELFAQSQAQAPVRVVPPLEPVQSSTGKRVQDENMLILGVGLAGMVIDDPLLAYGDEQGVLLPLTGVCRALDLPIEVEPNQGQASGWFISQGRNFDLDLKAGTLNINGAAVELPIEGIEQSEDDIYVDAKLISKWLPADFSISRSELQLEVEPRENFPFLERLARQGRRQGLDQGGQAAPTLPLRESEYSLFSMPFADFNTTTSYDTESSGPLKSSYTMTAKGNMGFMASDLFISGSEDEPFDNLRFKLERTDPQARLLGPLAASSMALGDISTSRLPFVSSKWERGMAITNKDLLKQAEFDTTTFRGDLPPGWEVEIYRNGSLVASTTVGSDGQYNLEEIPLYHGENNFKIISYGPQGQENTETRTINVGAEMLSKGKSRYEFSVSQQDSTIVDSNDGSSEHGHGEARLAASYEYGLSKSLSLASGMASQVLEDGRHNYLSTGVQASFGGIFAKADLVHDHESGQAVQLLSQSSLGPFRLRAKHDLLFDFADPDLDQDSDPANHISEFSLSGRIPKFGPLPTLPYSMTYQNTSRDNSSETNLTGRLSANLLGNRFTNTLTASRDTGDGSDTQVDGSLYFSRWLGPVSLRGNLEYSLDSQVEVDGYNLNGLMQLDDKLSAQVGFTKDIEGTAESEASLALNWDAGPMMISPKVTYDSEGNASAMLSLNFSLGREPKGGGMRMSSKNQAGYGAVSAKVYHDKNNNQTFDAGDEPLQGVGIRASQAGRSAKSDQQGIAFVTGIPKYTGTDVVLDRESLEDPFWEPTSQGNSIIAKPGQVEEFDFPVVTTGEIDGTLFSTDADGSKTPLVGRQLALINSQGQEVGRVRSEFDGFYLFERLLPGEYTIQVLDQENEDGLSMDGLTDTITIEGDGTVVNGMDFMVNGKGTRATAMVDQLPGQEVHPNASMAGLRDEDDSILVRLASPLLGRSYPEIRADKVKNRIQEQQIFQEHYPAGPLPPVETNMAPSSAPAPAPTLAPLPAKQPSTPSINLTGGSKSSVSPGAPVEAAPHRVRLRSIPQMQPAVQGRPMRQSLPIKQYQNQQVQTPPTARTDTRYSVQMASFQSMSSAGQALDYYRKSFQDLLGQRQLAIMPVDLGEERGTWYRVVAPGFGSQTEASRFGEHLASRRQQSQVISSGIGSDHEIHLASYSDPQKAADGLREIKGVCGDLLENRDFAIRRVELGADKGVWYRIMASGFEEQQDAVALSKELANRQQYAKVVSSS